MKFPESASQLVEELDRLYPERVPDEDASLTEIQRYAGRREVVLFLKNWRGQMKRAVARRDRS